MTNASPGYRSRELLPLLVILAIAAAVRFYKLGDASLWLDEAETVRISGFPLSVLWVTAYDSNPPLYYTIFHFLLNFGHSEFLLRLPSVIFGVLSIAVMYLATRRIGGPLAATMVALLLTFSFHNIEYSQEARTYALLGFCLAVSFLGLVQLAMRWNGEPAGFTFREMIRAGGGLYALGLVGALYSHNTAVFYWLGAQLFFLAWWVRPFRFSGVCLGSWIVINSLVLLLWSPWLLASLQIIERGSFDWLKQADPAHAFSTWRNVHGIRTTGLGQPYLDSLLAGSAVFGLYCLRRNVALVALLLGLLVSSSLLIWAYGFVSTPVYMTRTILWGSLFSALLIGIGLSRLPRILGVSLIAIFLIGQLQAVYDYFETNVAESENWRDLATFFNEHQRPNDILLIRQTYVSTPFFYYVEQPVQEWEIYGWGCRAGQGYVGRVTQVNTVNTVAWERASFGPTRPIPPKAGANLWVVESHCRPKSWDEADAVFFPNWRLHESHRFKQIYLHQLKPAPRW